MRRLRGKARKMTGRENLDFTRRTSSARVVVTIRRMGREKSSFPHNPQIPAIRQLLGERVKSTLCRPSRSAASAETPETGLRRKEWKAPGHEAERGTCALDIVLRVAGNENRYSFGPSQLQSLNQIREPFSGRPQTRCFPRSRNRDC
jgi:hypothetical protein